MLRSNLVELLLTDWASPAVIGLTLLGPTLRALGRTRRSAQAHRPAGAGFARTTPTSSTPREPAARARRAISRGSRTSVCRRLSASRALHYTQVLSPTPLWPMEPNAPASRLEVGVATGGRGPGSSGGRVCATARAETRHDLHCRRTTVSDSRVRKLRVRVGADAALHGTGRVAYADVAVRPSSACMQHVLRAARRRFGDVPVSHE